MLLHINCFVLEMKGMRKYLGLYRRRTVCERSMTEKDMCEEKKILKTYVNKNIIK